VNNYVDLGGKYYKGIFLKHPKQHKQRMEKRRLVNRRSGNIPYRRTSFASFASSDDEREISERREQIKTRRGRTAWNKIAECNAKIKDQKEPVPRTSKNMDYSFLYTLFEGERARDEKRRESLDWENKQRIRNMEGKSMFLSSFRPKPNQQQDMGCSNKKNKARQSI